jgi:hypothetical protein
MERSALASQPQHQTPKPEFYTDIEQHETATVRPTLGKQPVRASDVLAMQRMIGNGATQWLLGKASAADKHPAQPAPSVSGGLSDGLLQLMRIDNVPAVKSQWEKKGPFVTGVDLNCGWYCLMAALEYSINKLGLTNLDAPEILAPKTTKRGFAPYQDAMEYVTKLEKDPADITAWENELTAHGPLMVARDLAIPLIGHFVLIVGIDTDSNEVEFFDPLSAGKSHFISFDKFQKVLRPGKISYVNEDALAKKDAQNKRFADLAAKSSKNQKAETESGENLKGEKETEEIAEF